VQARPRRQRCPREQLVDRHVGESRAALGEPGRDVPRAAKGQLIQLETELASMKNHDSVSVSDRG
jgi:hypothetical protein